MNDKELDEILDTWSAPEPPASLRGRVRARYAAAVERPRGHRRLAVWATAFGALAFLVVLTQAFPQTAKLRPAGSIPFTVDSEVVYNSVDGRLRDRVVDQTSYAKGGQEIVLSQTIRDHPLESFFMNFHQSMYAVFQDLHALFGGHSEDHPNLGPGCAASPSTPHETILSYDTVKLQVEGNGRRAQTWLAPALGCFPMRQILERQRVDGTYRAVMERHAVKVTVNKVQ
jgi:hypothetical protein